MMEICEEKVTVTTTGAGGAAAGNSDSVAMHGLLLDIYLDYHASAPGSTDVTITHKSSGAAILAVANNATDGLYVPRTGAVDATNSAISGAAEKVILNGLVNVAVAQSNALTGAVVATFRYLRF
jgi:hypothetical protein